MNGSIFLCFKTTCLFVLSSFIFIANSSANHIFGGELEATCTGGGNYDFKLTSYIDCGRVADMPAQQAFEVYNAANTLVTSIILDVVLRDTLPVIPNSCATSVVGTCVGRLVYTGKGNLPLIVGGYTLAQTNCCRNANINNLVTPESTSQIYILKLPGSELVSSCNSGAKFTSLPPSEICTNMPMSLDFSAVDSDGDLLKYRFVNPLGSEYGASSQPPNPLAVFKAPYTYLDPLNSGIKIDSLTGIITGTPKYTGLFVISIAVDEYRGGKKIGTKIRDFTYTIVACSPVLTSNNPTVSNCANLPVQFDYTFAGLLKAGTTPHWNFGDPGSGASNLSTIKNPTHQYPALGTYFAIVNLEDECGNVLNDTVRVDIVETRAHVSDDGPHCKGETVVLSSTDANCSQMTWYADSLSTTVLKTGCTYSFVLGSDPQCLYFEPYIDTAPYTVGATAIQSSGTDIANAANFDAKVPLVIDGFSLAGDQSGGGCHHFNGVITVEKAGVIIAGPLTKEVHCDIFSPTILSGLNLKVPAGTGYTLKISGGTLTPSTGVITQQTGLINIGSSGPFYNWKVQSDQKCAKRDKICVNSVCPCPDSTLKFPAAICSDVAFDLNTLKTGTTSAGVWSIVSAPPGVNPAVISGAQFNVGKKADGGAYTLQYTFNGGPYPTCVDSNVRIIQVNAKDSAKITVGQGPFCLSEGVQTLKKEIISSPGTWSGTGITNNTAGTFDPATAGVGKHKITYLTDGNCWDQDTISITVVSKKIADIITLDTAICANALPFKIRVSNTTTPGGIWLSSPAGLVDNTGKFDASKGSAGIYKVSLLLSGTVSSCSAADSIVVTINPVADASISTPSKKDFCPDDSSRIFSSVILPAIGTWWSIPAGAIDAAGVFTPATAASGKTKIYYGISGSCGDTNSFEITMHNKKDPAIVPFGPLCESASALVMEAASTGIWTVDGAASSGIFLAKNYSQGFHKVKLSINDFCPVFDSIQVEVKKIPLTLFSADKKGGCPPLLVNFSDNSDSVALRSKWQIQQSGKSIDSLIQLKTATFSFTNPGCYDVVLTNQYAYSCESKSVMKDVICVEKIPEADFEFLDLPKNIQDPSIGFHNYSRNANTYFWLLPEGSPDTSSLTHAYTQYHSTVQDTFPVTLIARNKWCSDTLMKKFILEDIFEVYIPNAFTPDGNGKNDLFYPLGRNLTGEKYEFSVFDRWGEMIFHSTVPGEGWNGKRDNGLRDAQIDVYVWRLIVYDIYNHEKETYIGKVTLLR